MDTFSWVFRTFPLFPHNMVDFESHFGLSLMKKSVCFKVVRVHLFPTINRKCQKLRDKFTLLFSRLLDNCVLDHPVSALIRGIELYHGANRSIFHGLLGSSDLRYRIRS